MRPIFCSLHNRIFRGPGTTRVCRFIVFFFCAPCWTGRRAECDQHMLRTAGLAPRTPTAAESGDGIPDFRLDRTKIWGTAEKKNPPGRIAKSSDDGRRASPIVAGGDRSSLELKVLQ